MIRIQLPFHLSMLAHAEKEVLVDVEYPPTLGSALHALEARYPVLCGTILDQTKRQRRPFLRFYACKQDLSQTSLDTLLPEAVLTGAEPLLIIGAIAGG
jgi:sulfur-carrier protein